MNSQEEDEVALTDSLSMLDGIVKATFGSADSMACGGGNSDNCLPFVVLVLRGALLLSLGTSSGGCAVLGTALIDDAVPDAEHVLVEQERLAGTSIFTPHVEHFS